MLEACLEEVVRSFISWQGRTCKCYAYKRPNGDGVRRERLVVGTSCTTTGRMVQRTEWELYYAKNQNIEFWQSDENESGD